jgi:hypothetical protein
LGREVVIIESEAPLEGAIGHAAFTLEQCHYLGQDFVKRHL